MGRTPSAFAPGQGRTGPIVEIVGRRKATPKAERAALE